MIYAKKKSWYKLLFTIATTALAACIGWLVSNFNFPQKAVVILNEIAIAAISIILAISVYKIRYYLNRFEED